MNTCEEWNSLQWLDLSLVQRNEEHVIILKMKIQQPVKSGVQENLEFPIDNYDFMVLFMYIL